MFKIDLMKQPVEDVEAWDDGGLGQVAGILISYSSSTINSLRFLYFKDGAFQFADEHGQLRNNTEMISLDYPAEFLTGVHGFYSRPSYDGETQRVSSITFVSNKATHGPFGQKVQPESFYTSPSTFKFIQSGSHGDWINGFHGSTNTTYGGIASIGIYLRPKTTKRSNSGDMESES